MEGRREVVSLPISVRVCPSSSNLLLPQGEKGGLGILKPETQDGTQGLPKKPAPVRLRAGETPALPGCARMPAHAGAFKGGVPGSDTRCAAFRWAFAPHFHDTLFPHGLRADRTFEQRCVFCRCNGQSTLNPRPLSRTAREGRVWSKSTAL